MTRKFKQEWKYYQAGGTPYTALIGEVVPSTLCLPHTLRCLQCQGCGKAVRFPQSMKPLIFCPTCAQGPMVLAYLTAEELNQ